MARYTCPHCRNPFTTSAAAVPKRVRCPHCHKVVALPAASLRWFCARAKKKYGPYTWDQLVERARRGDLQPGDMVLREGTKQWARADSVPDLFPPIAAVAPQGHAAAPAPTADRPARRAFPWLLVGLASAVACVLLGVGALSAFLYFQTSRADSSPRHANLDPGQDVRNKSDTEPTNKKNEPPEKKADAVKKNDDPPKKIGQQEKPKPQIEPNEKWTEPFVQRLNEHRRAAGLGPVTLDVELCAGCAAHAKYLALHVDPQKADPSEVYDEDAKKEGYSAAGQRAAQSSIAAFADPLAALERWMGRLLGRGPLLSPEMHAIGLGFARNAGGEWLCVIDPVRGRGEPIVIYPAPKQTDVPVAFSGGPELPQANTGAGFPITVAFPPGKSVTGATIELSDSAGKPIDAWTWTPEKPLRPGPRKNTLALIAKNLLQSNAVYHVKAAAQIDGKPWKLDWSFTTEDDSDHKGVWATKALAKVNAYRQQAGLKPVALDPALSKGCLAHARYLVINEGQPALQGLNAHREDPKLPGYSAEGDKAGQASDIGFGDHEPIDSVDAWMATLYHRVPILEPNLKTIGFGCVRGKRQGWVTVLNVSGGRTPGRPHAVYFPAADQTGVPISFPSGGEEPNPIPDDKDGRAGFPVTAIFPRDALPGKVSGTMTNAKGADVPVWFSSGEKVANAKFARNQNNTICLIPKDPLAPNTTYHVHLKGTHNGAAWEKRWKFTTGEAGESAAGAARAALARINAFRLHAGLGPVVLDPQLSRGCQLHAEYLGKNSDALRKTKASVNDEDPQLPWYHVDGRRAARQSLIFTGAPTPVMQIDDLMATALSRSSVLDPNLQRIGYGCYHDVGRGWRCVYDPNSGRGSARVIVYPAADQKGVPTAGFDRVGDAKKAGGFPITVTFPPRAVLRNAQAVLVDVDKKDIAIHVSSPQAPLVAKLQRHTIAVHPLAPLQAGQTYEVTVSVIVDGAEWRQTWRFTTAN